MTTSDKRNLAWLEADTSYWVMGCADHGKYLVLHGSGLAIVLPREARFRVINGGRYDESAPVQIHRENLRFDADKGEAFYEAVIGTVLARGFVAVQLYADGQPCGASVEQLQHQNVAVCVNFKSVADGAKITYSAHYFVDGNELHQSKSTDEW